MALVAFSATAVFAQDTAHVAANQAQPDPYQQTQTDGLVTSSLSGVQTGGPSQTAIANNTLDKLPRSLFPDGTHTYTASGHVVVFGKGLGPSTVERDANHIEVKTSAGNVSIDPDAQNPNLIDVHMPSGTVYQATLTPSANGKKCTATIDAKHHVDFTNNGHGIDIVVHGFPLGSLSAIKFIPFKLTLIQAS